MSIKYIALYLPQYHPVAENDRWYGKGFTEWTNVVKAKKLFWGHYEPHIPADLGFYDLRLREVRQEQANLAKEYGIGGFCYWHYWFGNGKELLDMPFKEVVKDKDIDLPFALAWANHSWEKKLWSNQAKNEMMVVQQYPGIDDYRAHYESLLSAFKDERYIKVDNKPLFLIYQPLHSDEIRKIIILWNNWAKEDGFKGIYFVGKDFNCKNKRKILEMGFDAVYDDTITNIHSRMTKVQKAFYMGCRKLLGMPTVFSYKKAMRYMVQESNKEEDVYPLVAPNWDHSPRSGRNSIILHNCKPLYFEEILRRATECVANRKPDNRIVFIKSWNEWGEGNHLEPDLKYGKGYLEAVKKVFNDYAEYNG